MKPIAISLLVHEHAPVIHDQIENINHFAPEALIVLHVNPQFVGNDQEVLDIPKRNSRVFVNDKRLPIGWADLIQAHNANFRYLERTLPGGFSHFCLHASNDMFVNFGAEKYIRQHECGVNTFLTYPKMEWTPRRRCEHDPHFQAILRHIQSERVMCSQPEGTFYSRDLFLEMTNIIDMHFNRSQVRSYSTKNDDDHSNTLYAREEVYYPTIAAKLAKQCVFPYLFSEVMAWTHMSVDLIEAVRNKTLSPDYCQERRLLNPPSPLYDPNTLFAVKRIPRKSDDPLRQYIRGLTHGNVPSTTSAASPDRIG